MSKFILLVFICFSVGCNSKPPETEKIVDSVAHNQIATAAPAELSADSAVSRIRMVFQQINEATLTSKNFDWTEPNCVDEGTATYMFNSKGKIVKVVETGFIGDGSWTNTYYYQDGKFIFSLQRDIGGPAIGPVDTVEQRKYVYENKVIRTMENERYTTPTDSVLTPASKEYKILEAYKSKQFGAAFCSN